ncbi:hypothetical protein V6N13_090814 [Hibiscus sabdariffa]
MLDMGFEPHIRDTVELMEMSQTMLFTATFSEEIQRLASDFLSDYIFVSAGRVGSSTDLIVQRVELVNETDKRNRLLDLLRSQRSNGTPNTCFNSSVRGDKKRGGRAGMLAVKEWISNNCNARWQSTDG